MSGSYEGIRAIGQCCQMLEELTFSNHMDDYQLFLIAMTLRFLSYKGIDLNPWCYEDFSCIRKVPFGKIPIARKTQCKKALFLVCQGVKEIIFRNCWGLTDGMFTTASFCRSKIFAMRKPDSKSLLSDILAGTGKGRKGSRFFNKTCDLKSFPVA